MASQSNEEYIRKNRPELIDEDRNTKLHQLAAHGELEELKEYLENGAHIDPENYLGWTPLMMAVRNNKIDVVDFLLEKRADATKKNRFGYNVFLLSVVTGNLELIKRILEHLLCGGISRQNLQKTLSPLSLSLLFNHAHIFKYLLQQSFDVNAATPLTGLTPLMFASAVHNNRAIKRLISRGADPTIRNILGRTYTELYKVNEEQVAIEAPPDQPTLPQPTTTGIVVPPAPSSQQPLPSPLQPPAPLPSLPPSATTITSSSQQQQHQQHQSVPFIYIYPPTPASGSHLFRHSSEVYSPYMEFSPTITPITPLLPVQTFFGPDFVNQAPQMPTASASVYGPVIGYNDIQNMNMTMGHMSLNNSMRYPQYYPI